MPADIPATTPHAPLETPSAFRTLTRSLPEMAALTGVVLRLGRSAFAPDPADSLLYVGALYLLGTAFLLGMAALHLSNYTVRRWAWRAPVFVLVEVAAEMLTSLLLIALGREPWGTGTAEFHDWPTILVAALRFRAGLVLSFTLVLAAIVQGVRAWMARKRPRGA